MISVGVVEVISGNKDMRETELEAEKALEEGELEEGEACALLFWNEKNFDPDIDLPHIDDKVQLLLGHCMKDYENGILYEKSGAKYGGYGSFLPSSELSPSDLSHASTYQIHQNSNRPIYPYHFSLQKYNQDTTFRSSTMPGQIYASHPASVPVARAPAWNTTFRASTMPGQIYASHPAPFPVARAPAWNWNNLPKRDVWWSPYQGTGEFTTTFVTPNRRSNPAEQNSLKVLPRTGSAGNLAEKIGGLQDEEGLNSSPSLSEGILPHCRSLSPDIQELQKETPKSVSKNGTSIPPSEKCLLSHSSDNILCLTESPASDELVSDDESPMSILENRSSFPFSGECFLSPLSDSLLRLTMSPGGNECASDAFKLNKKDGSCESMGFGNANKVDGKNLKDSTSDKIHGDRKVSSCGDVQIDSRIGGRMNADKRSDDEMIQFDISEQEETTQTLLESYQLLTPDQQHNLDCCPEPDAHATSSTWPKDLRPAQCHQDHILATLPNVENRKENGSDDAEHLKSNAKRLGDQCRCKVTKKRRSDILYHANEDFSAENDGITGKLSSGHEPQIQGQPNNGSVARDSGSHSPVQNDVSCQSLDEVMKEGNDLEDKADFLKNIDSKLERAGLYFQAALRFFKGAFLLESYSIHIAKHREITDSMFLYKKAALLWESAANDYEECNEMAAAALAYKCMEVAFIRVVFSKAIHVEKDRHKLQMGLQNIHPGESPSSSSGSDVDNLYNQGMLHTGVGSRMRGYHAFVARNRPNIARVLNVVEDVHMVFKASKKCQKALGAATESCEESKLAADICLVQRVINFSFHDVDKLIHLVGLAMDAISH